MKFSSAGIAAIDSCYRKYYGCVLLVDEEEPELKSPASSFAAIDGSFWIAARDWAQSFVR